MIGQRSSVEYRTGEYYILDQYTLARLAFSRHKSVIFVSIYPKHCRLSLIAGLYHHFQNHHHLASARASERTRNVRTVAQILCLSASNCLSNASNANHRNGTNNVSYHLDRISPVLNTLNQNQNLHVFLGSEPVQQARLPLAHTHTRSQMGLCLCRWV